MLPRTLKALLVCLCLSLGPLWAQSRETQVSQEVDAEYLATVADSFKVSHVVVYAIAWQETRQGNAVYAFPRGPGKVIVDSIVAKKYIADQHGWLFHQFTRRICREIGRFQLSPCVNWVIVLKDPICSNANLLSKDKIFAYTINVHCAIKHIADLHKMYSWPEAIRHYNGTSQPSYMYLTNALAYIGQFHLRLTGEL